MKKGDVSLQSLVKLIPHLLLTIGLVYILYLLSSSFFSKELSPDEQDFNRIVEELKSMLDRKQDTDCIRVPVRSGSALLVSVNPKGSLAAPPGCSGDACLCHAPVRDGEVGKLNCVRFAKIDDCSESNDCFKISRPLTLSETDTVVTIIKDVAGIELKPNAQCAP